MKRKDLIRELDKIGEEENHPLASLMEVFGVLIEKYEDEHVTELPDDVQLLHQSRLHWLQLDVDLEITFLENADQYPLVYK